MKGEHRRNTRGTQEEYKRKLRRNTGGTQEE